PRSSKRRRGCSSKTPPKTPRGNSRQKNPWQAPRARNSFSLMGAFPCTPSLVVGEDGDLCPAASLAGKGSGALARTHPLWRWHLGGSAIPAPPGPKNRAD
ncbi:EPOP protein, partial [Pomatostomus ruficeps]|nr:EPOP protein [Pomatostomus ruficeps]